MDIPFLPFKKENVEVLQIPSEETLEVIKVMPSERVPVSIKKQIVHPPVPQGAAKILEVIEDIPQERLSERVVKQYDDLLGPQVVQEILEVIKIVPQEGVYKRIVERNVDVPGAARREGYP